MHGYIQRPQTGREGCTDGATIQSPARITEFTPSPNSPALNVSRLLPALFQIMGISIIAFGLREEEGDDGAEDGDATVKSNQSQDSKFRFFSAERNDGQEDPQDLVGANLRGPLGEPKSSEDGTALAAGGREAVGGTTKAGRENFGGVDEGGGVGTEVEEELEEGEADNEGGRLGLERGEVAGDNTEEKGFEEETANLDRLAANVLDLQISSAMFLDLLIFSDAR